MDASKDTVHIPQDLIEAIRVHVGDYSGEYVMSVGRECVAPRTIEWEFRARRPEAAMRFHDLRHYLPSPLISQGADLKLVPAAMRHASAKTTIDTYPHLWPDATERAATSILPQRHKSEAIQRRLSERCRSRTERQNHKSSRLANPS
jgi:integrase